MEVKVKKKYRNDLNFTSEASDDSCSIELAAIMDNYKHKTHKKIAQELNKK